VINGECKRLFPKDVAILAEPGASWATACTRLAEVIGKADRDGKRCYYINDGVYTKYSGIIFDHCKYPVKAFKKGRRSSAPCSVDLRRARTTIA
jgi:ornithine decarboxylase